MKIALYIMVRVVAVGFVFISLSCSWAKNDKLLYGSYIALSTIDAIQTTQFDEEYNPLLSSNGKPDFLKIVPMKLLSAYGVYWIADRYPGYRTMSLGVANGLQGFVVIYNFK